MAQTLEGAIKIAASVAGVTVERYNELRAHGQKHCYKCRTWKSTEQDFNVDISRTDGRFAMCRTCQREAAKKRYEPHPATKHGPPKFPQREGDEKQARHFINLLVRTGKIPKANDVPCALCGHKHEQRGSMRHEYHHQFGYSAGKHLLAQPLCVKCHHQQHTKG